MRVKGLETARRRKTGSFVCYYHQFFQPCKKKKRPTREKMQMKSCCFLTEPSTHPDHESFSNALLELSCNIACRGILSPFSRKDKKHLPSPSHRCISFHFAICSQRARLVCSSFRPRFPASGMIINYHGMGC